MKKTFKSNNGAISWFLNANFLFGLIMLLVTSCAKNISDDVVNVWAYETPLFLEVGIDSLYFSAPSQTSEVIVVNTEYEYMVTSDCDWLTFEKGEEGFTVTSKENATLSNRKAVVTVSIAGLDKGKLETSFPVSQDIHSLSINIDSISFENAGGTSSIISIDTEGEYDIMTKADWLTINKVDEKHFSVTATENKTPDVRIDTVTIFLSKLAEGEMTQTISITQDSKYLSVETNSILFTSSKGGKSEVIHVAANGIFDARSDVDWLTFEKQDSSIIVIAGDNASSKRRTAVVTIFLSDLEEGVLERTVSITQYSRYLDVSLREKEFDCSGGSVEVQVSSDGIYDIRSDSDWVTINKKEDSFIISIIENKHHYYRKVPVLVFLNDLLEGSLSRTVVIKQEGSPGIENGHEWIDLGLPSGLLWATSNVGVRTPEKYGIYFAWGETEGTRCSMDSYKFGTVFLKKYNTKDTWGSTLDNKTVLELSDDAANVKWGGCWRMPTVNEWKELQSECTWIWTTLNEVSGRKVIGPNGNSIFLPAAGAREDISIRNAGEYGYYWSSSLNKEIPSFAYYMNFGSSRLEVGYGGRYIGNSVRPVCRP